MLAVMGSISHFEKLSFFDQPMVKLLPSPLHRLCRGVSAHYFNTQKSCFGTINTKAVKVNNELPTYHVPVALLWELLETSSKLKKWRTLDFLFLVSTLSRCAWKRKSVQEYVITIFEADVFFRIFPIEPPLEEHSTKVRPDWYSPFSSQIYVNWCILGHEFDRDLSSWEDKWSVSATYTFWSFL